MKLYVIRDVLVGFGRIGDTPDVLSIPNDEAAVRVVKISCAKGMKPNALNVNAKDKELWCVGELDHKTGRITACEPYCVAKCSDYVEGELIADDQSTSNAEKL